MKKNAICRVMSAPIYPCTSDSESMITQILYGERLEILEEGKIWTKIKTDFDQIEGWTKNHYFEIISAEIEPTEKISIKDNFIYKNINGIKTLLSLGSEIDDELEIVPDSNLRESIVEKSKQFLNIPYINGGRSFFGVDAASFVQLVFKVHNIKLPRFTLEQSQIGEALAFIEESQIGDLAFFENQNGIINHVGIILENQNIIHAFGKVRIDTLDSLGIFNKEENKHTHRLRFVKNIIG